MSACHSLMALLLLPLLGACGPGVEEGPLPRAPDSHSVAADAAPDSAPDLQADVALDAAPDSWTCRETFASNYDHVQNGRATVCGGYVCARGSGENIGLFNTVQGTWLKETAPGYFEQGRC